MKNIVLLQGKRSIFGKFGGSLKDISATNLAVYAAKDCLKTNNINPDQVDHIVLGNVVQSSADSVYTPRHFGLKLGIPQYVPALGVQRLCGSGFQSLITAAQMITTGEASCILAGGTEQMSQIPYIVRNARWGMRMGHQEIEDYLTAALTDQMFNTPMAITAENLAEQYDLDRSQVDAYALQSQERFEKAVQKGWMQKEVTPISISSKKGEFIADKDEHPKPGAELASLSKLPAVFKKNGVVTAGNASGIVDGAAVNIVTTIEQAEKNSWQPQAKLVSYASVGCDPQIMGIGPVKASQMALEKAGLKMSDMDIIEINEAFAAQYLAVQKELKLENEITNVNGGSIAVGHPLGATGTRIINHLIYELQRRQGKYALGSACIGGGQGIAMIIERFQ